MSLAESPEETKAILISRLKNVLNSEEGEMAHSTDIPHAEDLVLRGDRNPIERLIAAVNSHAQQLHLLGTVPDRIPDRFKQRLPLLRVRFFEKFALALVKLVCGRQAWGVRQTAFALECAAAVMLQQKQEIDDLKRSCSTLKCTENGRSSENDHLPSSQEKTSV